MLIQIHTSEELKKSLRKSIREKTENLQKYYGRIERADVYLREGDGKLNDSKIVEIRLAVPGPDLFISEEAVSFPSAFGSAIDKLKRLIIKHKEKIKKH